ncbi:MAG: hypothetical protein JWO66_687, partial [Candidatus Eremiobacteraeota bacterium]|nr:hypothetical protein [Candidatus Eremiobacteraeota bacterium]
VQSAARSTDKHVAKTPSPSLVASPASLEFTADQAAAGTAQTVTITAKSDKKLAVTIAGTGNCPTVSPSALKLKGTDQEGNHEGDHADVATGAITVTPSGAGPATCTITVASSSHKDEHDAKSTKGHHENDNDDHEDNDDAAVTLTIPVIVDAPVVATPSPSPTPGR